jgi:hypothetical protein
VATSVDDACDARGMMVVGQGGGGPCERGIVRNRGVDEASGITAGTLL